MIELERDLRQAIADGSAVIVVGCGVSIAASGGAEAAQWVGLLRKGATLCRDLGERSSAWLDRQLHAINSGDVREMISAAERITEALGGPTGGEFQRWLAETVGSLEVYDPGVIEAIRDLRVPILTTNYDTLIEDVTGADTVTWQDASRILSILNARDLDSVVHVHGCWKRPDSVVFGDLSYAKVTGDPGLQAALHAAYAMRSLVFVGFGAGLGDPNFASLFAWVEGALAGARHRSFRLVDVDAVDTGSGSTLLEKRLAQVHYGRREDLGKFLRGMSPPAAAGGMSPPAAVERRNRSLPRSVHPRIERVRCIGRDAERDAVVVNLLVKDAAILILGSSGIGKTTLALAAMSDERVIRAFRDRRYVVRCEAATSAQDVWRELAGLTGIGFSESLEELREAVLSFLESASAVVVLDNLEAPWIVDLSGTEGLVESLGTTGVTLVVTFNGRVRPFFRGWTHAIELEPLSLDDSRALFLGLTGAKFADDPRLLSLLDGLGGLPLAIELLAYRATSEPDLVRVSILWERDKTSLLKRQGGAGRQDSLADALNLSIAGPRLNDEARDALSTLAMLPSGMAHGDLGWLGDDGETAISDLRAVGLVQDRNGRSCLLPPVREHVVRAHQPSRAAAERLETLYLELISATAGDLGTKRGGAALTRFSAEAENCAAMLRRAARGPRRTVASDIIGTYGECLVKVGRPDIETVNVVLAVARSEGDRSGTARALAVLGQLARLRGDLREAFTVYESALAEFEAAGDDAGRGRCLRGLGDVARMSGDVVRAERLYGESWRIAAHAGDTEGLKGSLFSLGAIAYTKGDVRRALVLYTRALRAARAVTAFVVEASCLRAMGDMARHAGLADDARALYTGALGILDELGNTVGEASCIQSMAHLNMTAGRVSEATSQHEKALSLYRHVGHRTGEASSLHALGTVAIASQDYDRGLSLCQRALDVYSNAGHRAGEAACLKSLGDIELALGQQPSAEVAYRKAYDLYRDLKHSAGEAQCAEALGLAARQVGDYKEGVRLLTEAYQMFLAAGHYTSAERVRNLLDGSEPRADGNARIATRRPCAEGLVQALRKRVGLVTVRDGVQYSRRQ